MVWFAFALMSVAAVLCVAWPLLRPHRFGAAAATDLAFYRRQLAELDADADRGTIRPADVEAARAELGRRLIRAAERPGASEAGLEGRARGIVALFAGAFVLLVGGGLYIKVGHPGEPDAPLEARLSGRTDFAGALAKIETHLIASPDDARAWEIMAPLYMKLGRFDDAARAYRNLIRLTGPSPARRAALGQALTLTADGVVTDEARQAFDAALAEDPSMPEARFFEGLAALQDGDKPKARAIWTVLLRDAPPGAPYVDGIRQRVAELDGVAPAPAAPALGSAPSLAATGAAPGLSTGAAALASLPADQRQQAIRGMVDGLAARLDKDGHDAEGWMRLVRAYRVLGEQDKARKALADARRSMAGDAQVLGDLDRLARELGLEG